MAQWLYLPVIAWQDWVAVLDKQGQIRDSCAATGFKLAAGPAPCTRNKASKQAAAQ